MVGLGIAYIAGGELFVLRAGETSPRSVVSGFASEVRERAAAIQRKHAWKSEGRGARFQRGMAWGLDTEAGQPHAVQMTSVAGLGVNRLAYTLRSGSVFGVFVHDLTQSDAAVAETRLFHTADHQVDQVASPHHGHMLCTVRAELGSTLAVMQDDGSELTEITTGDTLDGAPSWIPGRDRFVVFQSAGVGRNAEGYVAGVGPHEVRALDVPGRAVETLLADPKLDFLMPRISADGTLYCIQRPYTAPGEGGSFWRALGDVVLFPFRLVLAVLHWLNYFTASMTGKPLTTAGLPRQKAGDARRMMVLGNLIDAERDGLSLDGDPTSVVPASWQLIKKAPDGTRQTLAKGVVSYDLLPDGGIVYSNGSVIYSVGADGRRVRIAQAEGISALCVLR